MSRNYRRLSYQDRIGIYYLVKQGLSQRAIAQALQFSPSTISRELQRNRTGKLYLPSTAQRKTRSRWFKQARKLDKFPCLKQAIFTALRKQWSPEEISFYLKRHYSHSGMCVAAETIYIYL